MEAEKTKNDIAMFTAEINGRNKAQPAKQENDIFDFMSA
jgi:hypothetical protein